MLLFLISCSRKSSSDLTNEVQGYADSQLVGTWKITAYTSDLPFDWDGNGSTETNIYTLWTACQKDNLFRLESNKTGNFRISCSTTADGNWQIVNSRHFYYAINGFIPDSEKIISMTSVQFRTTLDVTTSSGLNLTLTKTWSRQ